MKCASKPLESIGINEYESIILTTYYGIEKNGAFHNEINLETVIQGMRDPIRRMEPA